MLCVEDTRITAFNKLNEIYYGFFDEYRFSDYDSFRKSLRLWLADRVKQ